MHIDDQLTARKVNQDSESESPRSELIIDGIPTGQIVPGAVLEAAVEWKSCHLVFMTDDVPFEEMLRILLLDSQLKLLDSAQIGGPYSTGSFSSLTLREPDTVQFRFIGGTTWSVQLLSTSRLRVPFISEPRGVHRAFGFSRRFVVRGNPIPQTT
jgi:hypothetical protein